MADPPPPCDAWFGPQPMHVVRLGASGFSGSRVFLVERPGLPERFVLKSFAPHATRRHAAWVHRLMRHLRAEGIGQVPALFDSRCGDRGTLVADADGVLWELAAFMSGRPCERPSIGQATAAADLLARVHIAASSLPGETRPPAPSPGLLRRSEQARAVLARPWRDRHAACRGADDPLVARLGAAAAIFERMGGANVLERLASLEPKPLPLQPVLRDVWSEHVFFGNGPDDAERVTAIVDYHAAGIDTPATDLARLFGNWSREDGEECTHLLDAWSGPLAAYDRVRPLGDAERRLVPVLASTAAIFGLDNWFRWTLEERRAFDDAGRVLDRIDRLLAVLAPAIEQAGEAVGRLN
jgi:Ser/Thr protein kinase RdoA (MazF antagonist)